MTRQTILGWLFLVLGVLVIAIVCAPAAMAVYRGGEAVAVQLPLLLTGVAVTVFGAWLLPSSGVGPTAANILVVASPFIPSFGRRTNSGEVKATPEKEEGGP